MPTSDYIASSGALKLKGVAGVTKPKKKKKPKFADTSTSQAIEKVVDDMVMPAGSSKDDTKDEGVRDAKQLADTPEEQPTAVAKTDAELRFEEKRRRRLEEKVKKEGGKTHKERVEELNRYLSKLSEHHDMYVFL
jgi:protein FAM32A